MNRPLFLSTIEQWLVNPNYMQIWVLYFICLLFGSSGGLMLLEYNPEETYLFHPLYMLPFIMMLGAGIVGKDEASGVLGVVLARPIKRSTFIITKWLALSVMCSSISLLLLIVEQTAATVTFPYLVPNQEFVINAIGRVSLCFGVSASMVALSSIGKQNNDFALWIAILWCASILKMMSTIHIYGNSTEEQVIRFLLPLWDAASRLMFQFTLPKLDFESITRNDGISWFGLSAYFCTIAISLVAACIFTNKKEVTYAAQ